MPSHRQNSVAAFYRHSRRSLRSAHILKLFRRQRVDPDALCLAPADHWKSVSINGTLYRDLYRSAELTHCCSAKMTHYLERRMGSRCLSFSKECFSSSGIRQCEIVPAACGGMIRDAGRIVWRDSFSRFCYWRMKKPRPTTRRVNVEEVGRGRAKYQKCNRKPVFF